jgi:hypothetical protein
MGLQFCYGDSFTSLYVDDIRSTAEFLAANPEVAGSISGATRFSE